MRAPTAFLPLQKSVIMIRMKMFLLCVFVFLTADIACAMVTSPNLTMMKKPETVTSKLHVGDPVPVFSSTGLAGQAVDLGSIVGEKPLLLVFWTSWCKDCPPKLRQVKDAVAALGKDSLVVVGVNVGMDDTEEKARAFIKENKMMYPNVFDKTGELSEKYQLNKVFSLIMVSKDGTILMRMNNVPIIDDSVIEMLNTFVRPAEQK